MSRISQHPTERDRYGLSMALAAFSRRENLYPGAAELVKCLLSQIDNDHAVKEPTYDALHAEAEALRERADKYATIERIMAMLECDERKGGVWAACTLLLIGSAHKMNSTRSVVDQEGVTVAGEHLGNWRVTVERVDDVREVPDDPADHLAALASVTAERDRLQRNLSFTEQWYAARFERLADLGKSAGCWDAMAAIIANGTADPYEPPTYAQQLVRANHRGDVAERELDQLRAEVEGMRGLALEARSVAHQSYIDRCDPEAAGELLARIDADLAAKDDSA